MNGTIEPEQLGRLARLRHRTRAGAKRWAVRLAPSDQESGRDGLSRTRKVLLAVGAMGAVVLWALVLAWMM